MFPIEKYTERRKLLKNFIKTGLVLFPGNKEVPYNYSSNTYRFRQDSNFLYFWGIDIPNVVAIIDVDSGDEMLFGNGQDLEDMIWTGPSDSISEIAKKSGINKNYSLHKVEDVLKNASNKGRKIHFVPVYRSENNLQLSSWLGILPEKVNELVSIDLIKAIIQLRSKKDDLEIKEIEDMVNVAYEMHTLAMKMAVHGNPERRIAGTIEGVCLSNGYNVSFPVICSIHGEILHNPFFHNSLKRGQLLLTDAGAESSMHYASDITRTTPVGGKFTYQQVEIYNIVLDANLEVIKSARPGILYKDIHLKAANVIIQGLKSIGLMKGNIEEAIELGAHALFFPHGVGHMLGLDVHDMEGMGEDFVGYDDSIKRSNQFGLSSLRMARKLEPGFVVTDEPGIYFIPLLIDKWKAEKKFENFINYEKVEGYKNFGGIRIEDDLLITKNSCKVLGKPIPKTPKDIEDIFKLQRT
jgi:Xaa-Pro aminopeptidase